MKTRIDKRARSLALRIPKPFPQEASLREGSAVDVTVQSGTLVVAIDEQRLSLEKLVGRITQRNRHPEVRRRKP